MSPISGSGPSSSVIQTNIGQAPSGATQVIQKPISEQVESHIFAKVLPRLVSIDDFPDLAGLLAMLKRRKLKLASMHGDDPEEYDVILCEGANAMIDRKGTVYMGVALLRGYANQHAVLVGALAHEIGHRPKRWDEPRYREARELTQEEIYGICREEETRADIFCGKGLAELGFDCEPIIEFLKHVQTRPHPEYFPAEVRADVIRESHAGRTYSAQQRAKLFPGFNRHHADPKGELGRG